MKCSRNSLPVRRDSKHKCCKEWGIKWMYKNLHVIEECCLPRELKHEGLYIFELCHNLLVESHKARLSVTGEDCCLFQCCRWTCELSVLLFSPPYRPTRDCLLSFPLFLSHPDFADQYIIAGAILAQVTISGSCFQMMLLRHKYTIMLKYLSLSYPFIKWGVRARTTL